MNRAADSSMSQFSKDVTVTKVATLLKSETVYPFHDIVDSGQKERDVWPPPGRKKQRLRQLEGDSEANVAHWNFIRTEKIAISAWRELWMKCERNGDAGGYGRGRRSEATSYVYQQITYRRKGLTETTMREVVLLFLRGERITQRHRGEPVCSKA